MGFKILNPHGWWLHHPAAEYVEELSSAEG